jgi:hypothetical protein
LLICNLEGDAEGRGGKLTVGDAVGNNLNGEALRIADRFLPALPVTHYAGKLDSLGDPAAVVLPIKINRQIHFFIIPRKGNVAKELGPLNTIEETRDASPHATAVQHHPLSDGGRADARPLRFDEETLWMTQAQIAELFQTTPQNVTLHLKAIFAEGELAEAATCKDYLQVRQEGGRDVSRTLRHYRLEAVLAVGYRVRSHRGVQFRQWATARLTEYLVKGFTMDDERLKNPPIDGQTDYFDELLERIRDIRASERRMYLRVREILELAADYGPQQPETQLVFQTIQNKLHFAATGKTAPELIVERGKAEKHGLDQLERWRGPQRRCVHRQELSARAGNHGIESDRGHVSGLCGGSSAAACASIQFNDRDVLCTNSSPPAAATGWRQMRKRTR